MLTTPNFMFPNTKQCGGRKRPLDRSVKSDTHISLEERKAYLKEKNICYRCCASTSHLAKDCGKNIQCRECRSDSHPTALHPGPAPWTTGISVTMRDQGGEQDEGVPQTVTSKCIGICGSTVKSRSCSKIISSECIQHVRERERSRLMLFLMSRAISLWQDQSFLNSLVLHTP